MNRHDNRRRGFTLAEVLVTLAFLAILIPVVTQALSLCSRSAVIAERTALAQELGENQLQQIVQEKQWNSSDKKGDFGEAWPGFSWEMIQESSSLNSMMELTMKVIFEVQGQSHSIQISTLVSNTTT